MGSDKAMLANGRGFTFAGHLVNCFGAYGCKPVVLVVNSQFDASPFKGENIVTVVNHHLEKGRSWSIHLGLKHVPQGSACFIQNIDNPFLEPGLLDILLGSAPPDGYAVPVSPGGGGHPVLLGEKVVDWFRQEPDYPDFRDSLRRFTRTGVSFPDERIRWNINTPGDYKEFIDWQRDSEK